MSLPLVTIILTATAALVHAIIYGSREARDYHSGRVDVMEVVFLSPILAVINTLWLSLITVPLVMCFFGGWGWPFADWSLLIQVGVVIPFLISLVFGAITFVLDWDKDLSPDRYKNETAARPRILAISMPIWLAGFVWMVGVAPIVALTSLIVGDGDYLLLGAWGIVALLPFSLVFTLGNLVLSENSFVVAMFVIFTLWFPLHIMAFLFTISPVLLLLAIPVALVWLALASDGYGGGYNSGPVISWFITK